jgi:hypothetical protein
MTATSDASADIEAMTLPEVQAELASYSPGNRSEVIAIEAWAARRAKLWRRLDALLSITGAFAEFERSIIQQRVHAGLARAKKHGTKSGKPFGRPKVNEATQAATYALPRRRVALMLSAS